ncbi:ABC transporter permease [Actinoplanes sp. NPDC049265]|uniref:ABC transporter permease n=1 Tax=Actinoplanes sp. NPDC049265 TaxID=3363902 RepID=UPI00371677DD
MTTLEAARLVAAREIKVKIRDKTFLFSTVFFLLIAIGSIALPILLDDDPQNVAVSPTAAASAGALTRAGLTVVPAGSDAQAAQLVRDGDADAAVVGGPKVLGLDEAPRAVVQALSESPPVELLEPDDRDPFVSFLVPFVLAFIFFTTSLTFGLQIAQSVTEEKATRIVEILVASVPVRALLAGKVAAMTLLAFGQIALISLVAFAGMRLGGVDTSIVSLILPAIGWFLPFFILGFVMLATLWAGAGALAARQEDLAGVSAPLQMIVMIPFFLTIFLSDNPLAMKVLSYIPLSAPLAMPIRAFTGDLAPWEPYVSLLILALSAAAMLGVGARLYEGSLLRTNGRTSFATAWRSRSLVN